MVVDQAGHPIGGLNGLKGPPTTAIGLKNLSVVKNRIKIKMTIAGLGSLNMSKNGRD